MKFLIREKRVDFAIRKNNNLPFFSLNILREFSNIFAGCSYNGGNKSVIKRVVVTAASIAIAAKNDDNKTLNSDNKCNFLE